MHVITKGVYCFVYSFNNSFVASSAYILNTLTKQFIFNTENVVMLQCSSYLKMMIIASNLPFILKEILYQTVDNNVPYEQGMLSSYINITFTNNVYPTKNFKMEHETEAF